MYIGGERMKQTVYDVWCKYRENILLTSDGGMGKTTQLIYCYREFLKSENDRVVPIYIDIKSLEYNERKPIFKYLCSTYFGKLNKIENIDEEIINALEFEEEDKLTYVFIIDGLNETINKYNIINDIRKLKNFQCCRFIVSSRTVEEDYVFGDFVKIRFLPLDKDNIIEHITKKLGVEYENIARIFDDAFFEIISNPLFLRAFCETYGPQKLSFLLKGRIKIRKADVLYAYSDKMLEEIKDRAVVEENNIIEFTIKFFLPRVAFVMAQEKTLIVPHEKIISWLYDENDQKLGERYFRTLLRGNDFKKYMREFSNNIDGVIEYCLASSLLKYEENQDSYIFSHHIWRDYFAAQHILNLINSCKFDELFYLPDDLMIREFVGELFKNNNLSECDYENKKDCDCDMSPIESFMQSKCSILNNEPEVIGNLIEIMKVARNSNITARYDNLDLKYANFIGCKLPNSSFINSKVYDSNFYAQGHSGYVYAATLTPDNRNVVSSGKDATIRIWDVSTQKQVGKPLRGHENYVVSVKTIKNGKEILSGSYDGTIRKWSIETHKQIGGPMIGHSKRINQICVTKDEEYVVSCSSDSTIRIWNINTGLQVGKSLCGHDGAINSVCVSPNGENIISAGEDGTVRVWDFKLGKQNGYSLLGHNCSVKSICMTTDGKYIISADQNGQIFFWDATLRIQVGETIKCNCDAIESIDITPDNLTVVFAGYDGKIRFLDAERRTLVGQIDAHGDWINGVEISKDGKLIVSSGGDQSIKLWETTTLIQIGEPLIGTNSWINSVKITSDSRYIISAGDDAAIRIWDIANNQMACEPYYGHSARINEIDVSFDGTIVSASDDGKIIVWNMQEKNQTTMVLSGHSAWVRTVLLSEKGDYAISGGWDNKIIVWDLITGKNVNEFTGHSASVEALAILKDKELLISGSDDGTIRFWSLRDGVECSTPVFAHSDWIRALKLLHNQNCIITGSWDNTISVWDLETGEKIGETLKGHTNRIDALAVSEDDVIISGSDDNTVRMWKIEKGTYKGNIIVKHQNAVPSVAISSDSKLVVSGDGSGVIKITYLDETNKQDEICELGLNIFNSDLTKISEKSEISQGFIPVLFQNGCKVNYNI